MACPTQERGFLPLSAALLSSSVLRSETGDATDMFVDIVSHIEAIILSLLFCRSGLQMLPYTSVSESCKICNLCFLLLSMQD